MLESNLDHGHIEEVLSDKYWDIEPDTEKIVFTLNPNSTWNPSGEGLEEHKELVLSTDVYWANRGRDPHTGEELEEKLTQETGSFLQYWEIIDSSGNSNSDTASEPLYNPEKTDRAQRRKTSLSAEERKHDAISHLADDGETPHERLKEARKEVRRRRASGIHFSDPKSHYEAQKPSETKQDTSEVRLAVIHNSSTTSIEELVKAASWQFNVPVSVETLTHAEAMLENLKRYDGVIFSGSDEHVAERLLDAGALVYAMGTAATTMAKKLDLPVEKADHRMVSGPNTTFNGHHYNHKFYILADQVSGRGFKVLAERDGMAYELKNGSIKLVQYRPENNNAGRKQLGSWLQSVYGKKAHTKESVDNQPTVTKTATTPEEPVHSITNLQLLSYKTPSGRAIEIPAQVSHDVADYIASLNELVDRELDVDRLGAEKKRVNGQAYLTLKNPLQVFPDKVNIDREVLDFVWALRSQVIDTDISNLVKDNFSYVLKELTPRLDQAPFSFSHSSKEYSVEGGVGIALTLLLLLGRDYVNRKRTLELSSDEEEIAPLSKDLEMLKAKMKTAYNVLYAANLELTHGIKLGSVRELEEYTQLNPEDHSNPTIMLPLLAGLKAYELTDRLRASAKNWGKLDAKERTNKISAVVEEILEMSPQESQKDRKSKSKTDELLPYNLYALAVGYVNLVNKEGAFAKKGQKEKGKNSLEYKVLLPKAREALKQIEEGIVLLMSSEYLRQVQTDYFMVLKSDGEPIRDTLHEAMEVNRGYVQQHYRAFFEEERALKQTYSGEKGRKQGREAVAQLDELQRRKEAGEDVRCVVHLPLPVGARVPLEKLYAK